MNQFELSISVNQNTEDSWISDSFVSLLKFVHVQVFYNFKYCFIGAYIAFNFMHLLGYTYLFEIQLIGLK